jgi:hypothetical protein
LEKTELNAVGIAAVPMISYVNGEELVGELRDALFVPGLGANLYSIELATELDINVNFHEDKANFLFQDNRIMVGQRVGKSLYHLKVVPKSSRPEIVQLETANMDVPVSVIPLSLAHRCLAHLNYKTIARQDRIQAVNGLKLIDRKCKIDCMCKGCILEKMKRSVSVREGRISATEIGGIIHLDYFFLFLQLMK